MNSVWISAIGLCGATLIGAVLGFGIKAWLSETGYIRPSARFHDIAADRTFF